MAKIEVTMARIEVRVVKILGNPKNWFHPMKFCPEKLNKIWHLQ